METQMTFKRGHDLLVPVLRCKAYKEQKEKGGGSLYMAVDNIITGMAETEREFMSREENKQYENPLIANLRYEMIMLPEHVQKKIYDVCALALANI